MQKAEFSNEINRDTSNNNYKSHEPVHPTMTVTGLLRRSVIYFFTATIQLLFAGYNENRWKGQSSLKPHFPQFS